MLEAGRTGKRMVATRQSRGEIAERSLNDHSRSHSRISTSGDDNDSEPPTEDVSEDSQSSLQPRKVGHTASLAWNASYLLIVPYVTNGSLPQKRKQAASHEVQEDFEKQALRRSSRSKPQHPPAQACFLHL